MGGGGGLLRYSDHRPDRRVRRWLRIPDGGWKLNLGNEWLEQIVIASIGAIIVVIIARIIV